MIDFETLRRSVETGLNKYMNSPFSFEIGGKMFWNDFTTPKTLTVLTDCISYTFAVFSDCVICSYVRFDDHNEPEHESGIWDFDVENDSNELVQTILNYILVDDLDDSEVSDDYGDEEFSEGCHGRHDQWDYDYQHKLLVK